MTILKNSKGNLQNTPNKQKYWQNLIKTKRAQFNYLAKKIFK